MNKVHAAHHPLPIKETHQVLLSVTCHLSPVTCHLLPMFLEITIKPSVPASILVGEGEATSQYSLTVLNQGQYLSKFQASYYYLPIPVSSLCIIKRGKL
jgi:hypothetical protein